MFWGGFGAVFGALLKCGRVSICYFKKPTFRQLFRSGPTQRQQPNNRVRRRAPEDDVEGVITNPSAQGVRSDWRNRRMPSHGSSSRRLRRTLQQLRRAAPLAPVPAAVTTLQVSTTPPADLLPLADTHPTPAQRKSFNDDGFVVVDDMVDPQDLSPLLAESRRIVAGVWDGSLPRGDSELTGLPNFGNEPEKTWAIRGLLSPHLASSVYADYICSEAVLRYLAYMLQHNCQVFVEFCGISPEKRRFSIEKWPNILQFEILPRIPPAAGIIYICLFTTIRHSQ